MEEARDRPAFLQGARDIAREVKRQAAKKVGRGSDQIQDHYTRRSYSHFTGDEDDDDDDDDWRADARNARSDGRPQPPPPGARGDSNEEGSSDATEGHDDEADAEGYEGEYQGASDGVKVAHATEPSKSASWDTEAGRRSDREELSQQYELILQECAHGKFQWSLFFTLGLALMADGVEMFVVGFVLPSAEKDMCLSSQNKGWLGGFVYVGMMLGAVFWGGLADKIGRRQCLLISLSFNGFFTCLSSFVQGYGAFLFCRFLSGIGIGGTAPVVFSYFAEFLSREKRGEHLSWLCMFGMIGGIYASAMAWAIIPHYGWSFSMGSAYQFHSWRVFVIVCALPAVSSVVALTFMPESPRYLLEMGRHDEAWMVLKQVHDTNMRAKKQSEKVFTVTQIKMLKQQDEMVEIETSTAIWYRRWIARVLSQLKAIWRTLKQCFEPQLKRTMMQLVAVWLLLSFGYYGLSVWFPEMIKQLQADNYASHLKEFDKERVTDQTFNFTLENQVHRDGEYINDRFVKIKFKHVIFENSLFKNCDFDDITSTNTFFKNCTFIGTTFYNTDLYDFKFVNSRLINSTFLHNKKGCHIDFSSDYSAYWVYFVTFLGTLAVLPGNIVSALLMDKIGRLNMLGGSMVLSGISCFLLWFGNSEATMIGMLCLYNGLTISAWNSLDVLTVELFPTDRRATGFGFLNALCRAATVMGNLIFGSLVSITKAIPILLASSVLVGGGLVSLRLPDTRNQVLM
ncbi:synaptic vesicle glycoprotein 2C-like [Petromyzon marinus]|uniref:synaptic vesicle glycoprotein 2C-like n=1 Tax=Petromyzon marinus TaxID=7757 RepID=UPI003F71F727